MEGEEAAGWPLTVRETHWSVAIPVVQRSLKSLEAVAGAVGGASRLDERHERPGQEQRRSRVIEMIEKSVDARPERACPERLRTDSGSRGGLRPGLGNWRSVRQC